MGSFKSINKRATATLGESKLVGTVRGEYWTYGTMTGYEFKPDAGRVTCRDYFALDPGLDD
jgi:hypothetical protein